MDDAQHILLGVRSVPSLPPLLMQAIVIRTEVGTTLLDVASATTIADGWVILARVAIRLAKRRTEAVGGLAERPVTAAPTPLKVFMELGLISNDAVAKACRLCSPRWNI